MNSTKKSAGKLFSIVVTVALICLMAAAIAPGVMGADPVDLGSAANFVILSQSGITNIPTSAITGNIGTSPITGAAITGLSCSEVTGTIYTVNAAGPACRVIAPALLGAAVGDMQTAYNDAAGRPAGVGPFLNVGAGTLTDLTLVPGIYTWTSVVTIPTDLTLDAQGDPNAVWIFQIAGTLDIASGKQVILIGGAQAKNIFWQVSGATTLGTYSTFNGNILDKTMIALQTGATLNGRALAQTAVTMDQNTVTIPEILNPPTIHPPVLNPIGDKPAKPVCVGQPLTFTISGRDPDKGDILTYSVSGLPTGAVFDPVTKTFTWTPSESQAGTYLVTFTVTDSGRLSDSETVTITVSNDGKCQPKICSDFITGGGWINDKATFGVSGGIKNDKFWGQLSFNDHNGVKVKSTSVTAYIVKDSVTREIQGIAKVNGKGSFTYTVIVADNGEPGRNKDTFSLQLSNGYSASGILKGGNIQLHLECGKPHDKDDKEKYDDKYERDGHGDCDNDRLSGKDLFDRFNDKNDNRNDNHNNDKGRN